MKFRRLLVLAACLAVLNCNVKAASSVPSVGSEDLGSQVERFYKKFAPSPRVVAAVNAWHKDKNATSAVVDGQEVKFQVGGIFGMPMLTIDGIDYFLKGDSVGRLLNAESMREYIESAKLSFVDVAKKFICPIGNEGMFVLLSQGVVRGTADIGTSLRGKRVAEFLKVVKNTGYSDFAGENYLLDDAGKWVFVDTGSDAFMHTNVDSSHRHEFLLSVARSLLKPLGISEEGKVEQFLKKRGVIVKVGEDTWGTIRAKTHVAGFDKELIKKELKGRHEHGRRLEYLRNRSPLQVFIDDVKEGKEQIYGQAEAMAADVVLNPISSKEEIIKGLQLFKELSDKGVYFEAKRVLLQLNSVDVDILRWLAFLFESLVIHCDIPQDQEIFTKCGALAKKLYENSDFMAASGWAAARVALMSKQYEIEIGLKEAFTAFQEGHSMKMGWASEVLEKFVDQLDNAGKKNFKLRFEQEMKTVSEYERNKCYERIFKEEHKVVVSKGWLSGVKDRLSGLKRLRFW